MSGTPSTSGMEDSTQISKSVPSEEVLLCVVDQESRRRYSLPVQDRYFLRAFHHQVLTAASDEGLELDLRDFTRLFDRAEEEHAGCVRAARLRIGETNSGDEADAGAATLVAADRFGVGGNGDHDDDGVAWLSLGESLANSLAVDSSLFFAVAREAYELSRDPFALRGQRASGGIWRLQGHCAAFRRCVAVFAEVYDTKVRGTMRSLVSFSTLRFDDLLRFRKAVWDGYRLPHEDPFNYASRSESNLEMRWVNDNIRKDKYFFPSGETGAVRAPSVADITLSYMPARRRAAASEAMRENEMQTFWLTQLLSNPSWEPDEAMTWCRECGRSFKSLTHPLGARAHHCRCCGRRLCGFCITKKAHRSFAKLRKPGDADEGEERFVCNGCYAQYLELERLRYLGALFAMAGLDFSHLALCRTVSSQWRQAAELCISEYRYLLHTCEADFHSVLTPVGVFLLNSVGLIASDDSVLGGDRGSGGGGSEPHVSVDTRQPGIHAEAALLLLKFIAQEGLWSLPCARHLVTLLARRAVHGSLSFSHWHFYCTAFCTKMRPVYFYMKAMELLCAAPPGLEPVRTTALTLAHKVLSHLLSGLKKGGRKAGKASLATQGEHSAVTSSAARTAAVAELELATVWLLDLLYKDAQQAVARRCYQPVLELLLPTLALRCPQLAILMLTSFQALPPRPSYDIELIALWRTRLYKEFDRCPRPTRTQLEATMNFLHELDAYCLQSSLLTESMVTSWIGYYCNAGRGHDGGAATVYSGHAPLQPSAVHVADVSTRGRAFVELPCPMCHPFQPRIVLRSVLLSGVQVEGAASSKPVWITFSTFGNAQRVSDGQDTRGKDSGEPERLYSFLYKRENVERDQLMCVSSRLLQLLLQTEIGSAEVANYSVLPLSPYSGLIERAEGYVLSRLPGMTPSVDITSFLTQRGEGARVNFYASSKLFLLLNYIFSIGDRHQGNVMLSPSGAILHIDFGFIFSERTFVEKLAGTTMRIDNQFLAAVASCRRGGGRESTQAESEAAGISVNYDAYFGEAAEWFLVVRSNAELFMQLWLYAVHRGALSFTEHDLAVTFNALFDRNASRTSSASNFANTMRHSINVCRLKDVTHSGVQALRGYAERVSRTVSGGGVDALRSLGDMWSKWRAGGGVA